MTGEMYLKILCKAERKKFIIKFYSTSKVITNLLEMVLLYIFIFTYMLSFSAHNLNR